MFERIVYTLVVLGGLAIAYALAERFGLSNGRKVVSQNEGEVDKHG